MVARIKKREDAKTLNQEFHKSRFDNSWTDPYPDGNGRMARLVMNTMLASGGYPWSVIHVEDRDPYLAALECASVQQDIEPFARFVADQVLWPMERTA